MMSEVGGAIPFIVVVRVKARFVHLIPKWPTDGPSYDYATKA